MTEFNAPLSVEEVGAEVRTVAPGDRVVCTWMTACGTCRFCVRGESRLCEELADHRLDVATMVTGRSALDDVNDGLAAIERGEVTRSVIVN